MESKWDTEAHREATRTEGTTFLGSLISMYWRYYKSYCVRTAVKQCGNEYPRILKTDLWNEAVGFAHGDITGWLPVGDYELYGIDISPLICKLAKIRLGGRIKVEVGDITKIPFGNHVFDIVLDVSTIDHLEGMDYGMSITEYHRVLKEGGILMLLFDNPLPFYLKPLQFGFNKIRFDNNPIKTKEITYWMEDAGYKILKQKRLFLKTSTMIIARA